MELGKRIKYFRNELSLSQDVLAEKVFVSRQTISNWENDKSYPDVNSLVLLSEIFGTSIDNLIKGDIEKMREEIRIEDRNDFTKMSNIYAILLIASIVAFVPLYRFLGLIGIAVWGCLFVITMIYAVKVEKFKKQHNIQTYKEITAFMDGKSLDEIEKARESGKLPYQKVLAGIMAGVITLVVLLILGWLLF